MPIIATVNGRVLAWNQDALDTRDFRFRSTRKTPVPLIVDLSAYCSLIENQGKLGSCTAQSIVGALEWLENKQTNTFKDLSRLFVYYNERVIDGSVNEDAGAYLRSGFKTLSKEGVCAESLWPYLVTKFAVKPSDAAYLDAKNRISFKYYKMNAYHQLITCLADGYPFVFGCLVDQAFCSNTTGKITLINGPSASVGGHAMLAVGYNLTNKTIRVRNSWGTSWGNKGYCDMPMAYFKDPSIAADFWTIRPATIRLTP